MGQLKEIVDEVREQILYLKEIGVDSLDADLNLPKAVKVNAEGVKPLNTATPPPVDFEIKTSEPKTPRPPAGSRLSSLPKLSGRSRPAFFDKYNPETPAENEKNDPESADQPINKLSAAETSLRLPPPTETIEQIRAEIGPDCTRCKLSRLGRKQVVNSVGNFNAELMFVGEAPGADEDEKGEPFVGRAGQLLTDIIEKGMGLDRSKVFIGNISRCRPPGNRAPEPDESAMCKPFLAREIAVVRPKVIVVLGATAAQNLLATKVPISKLRGHFHDHLGVKVMPTFHPAYLLRDPNKKREVWEDIKIVMSYLDQVRG